MATARAVEEAGYPAVATSSGAVARSLGFEDHEAAPPEEMLAAAARIVRGVGVPVTIDAEAGYGLDPEDFVNALFHAGAAGCNLEDTDHRAGRLRDVEAQARWLRAVRDAAEAANYPLVVNARIDVFLGPFFGDDPGSQERFVGEALERAEAYLEAGADCVYPITLWEPEVLGGFIEAVGAPVNVLALPQAGTVTEMAALGVARISWGPFLHTASLEHLQEQLTGLRDG